MPNLRGMKSPLSELLHRERIVCARDHPHLRSQLQRAERDGDARRVVPGIWAVASLAEHPRSRALAICRYDPAAVVIGDAAAAATYRRGDVGAGPLLVIRRGAPLPGFTFVQVRIAPENILRSGELRLSSPAWTALDLALRRGSGAIDEALRLGVGLEALTATAPGFKGRPGAGALRRWLEESQQQPWSPAERAAHAALDDAGVTGWVGNLRVDLPGRTAFLDIGLPEFRLGFEIDGFAFHSSHRAFTHDRSRDADLAAHGWQIVRVPAALVLDEPGRFVGLVRAVMRQRSGVTD